MGLAESIIHRRVLPLCHRFVVLITEMSCCSRATATANSWITRKSVPFWILKETPHISLPCWKPIIRSNAITADLIMENGRHKVCSFAAQRRCVDGFFHHGAQFGDSSVPVLLHVSVYYGRLCELPNHLSFFLLLPPPSLFSIHKLSFSKHVIWERKILQFKLNQQQGDGAPGTPLYIHPARCE